MGKRTKLFIGIGSAVVLIGAYFVMVMIMGADLGQPCDEEWGCKGLDAICLQGDDANMCSTNCASGADCPDGFECGSITVWTLDGKSANPDVSADKACIPAGAPASDSGV